MAADLTVVNVTPERMHLVLNNPDGYTVGKIMRTDMNGVRTVRTLSGQLPSTDPVIDLYDYEYAPAWDRVVIYQAYNAANTVIAMTTMGFFGPKQQILTFACPLYPSNGVVLAPADTPGTPISFGLSWTSTRRARTTLHEVIGRSDPVPVLRAAGTRAGDLTLICPDHATCELIESQLSLPYVFMLRQSEVIGLDCYVTVTSLSASSIPGVKRWQLVVGFAEIAWPPGSFVAPNVWTYADVLAQYGDYNAVAATYATYANLLDNIPAPIP